MGLLKQEYDIVTAGFDLTTLIFLADYSRHIGEKIESALRPVGFPSGYFSRQRADEVTAAFECLPHILHALLRSAIGSFRTFLGD